MSPPLAVLAVKHPPRLFLSGQDGRSALAVVGNRRAAFSGLDCRGILVTDGLLERVVGPPDPPVDELCRQRFTPLATALTFCRMSGCPMKELFPERMK